MRLRRSSAVASRVGVQTGVIIPPTGSDVGHDSSRLRRSASDVLSAAINRPTEECVISAIASSFSADSTTYISE